MRQLIFTFVVPLLLLASAGVAGATDYYVSPSGNDGNDGLTPATAWRTISHAVEQVTGTSTDPAHIHIGDGTYTRSIEGAMPITIPAAAGHVVLEGATEAGVVIDGGGAPAWQSFYALEVDGAASVQILRLTITQARGGIYVHDAAQEVTLQEITFDNPDYTDSATDLPAIRLDNLSGAATLSNLTITEARSEITNKGGGGILAENLAGSLLVEQSVLTETDGSWYRGGGLYLRFCADVTLNGLTLDTPIAQQDGGGIALRDISGAVQITSLSASDGESVYGKGGVLYAHTLGGDLTISGASVEGASGPSGGGAFYVEAVTGNVVVENSTVTSSTTSAEESGSEWGGGGAMLLGDITGDLLLAGLTISETSSGQSGGGISVLDVDGDISLQEINVSGTESVWGSGGGISIQQTVGELALRGVNVSGASADSYGGGISLDDISGGTVRLDSLEVTGSSTQWGDGGGVSIRNPQFVDSLLVSGMALSGNSASSQDGGGLAVDMNDQTNTYVHLDRITATGNSSGDWGNGGGVKICDAGTVDITNSTFYANWTDAAGGYYDGGGLYAEDILDLAVDNCAFMDNTAFGSGGGIALVRQNLNMNSFEVTNSLFLDNEANGAFWGSYGGGIYVSQGPETLVQNSLFAGNYARNDGGALYFDRKNNGDELNISSVTMAYNEAGDGGSAIYNRQNTDVEVWNSIIWANGDTTRTTEPSGDQTTIEGNTNSITYYYSNVEQDGGTVVDGTGNTNENPYFYDPENNDFSVVWGSPMIDSGSPYDPNNPYTYYDWEAEPNGDQVNVGYTPVAGVEMPGSGEVDVPGTHNSGSSEAVLQVVRNNYVFMGSPVVPDSSQNLHVPQQAWGDDMAGTSPSWASQTWLFSRWTNGTDYGASDPFIGYLRYNDVENFSTNLEVGDPPNIQPGLGYWFVYGDGAHPDTTKVKVDISLRMLEAEPLTFELEPLPTGSHVNPAQTAGYNMMANPWPFPINWGDIRFSTDQVNWMTPLDAAAAGLIENYAKTWDHLNEMYVNKTGRLDPWEGFFVLVRDTSAVWMQFNPDAVSPGAPTRDLDELDEELDWSLMLTARRVDALQVDYDNWIGVGPNLQDDFDRFDGTELAPLAKEAIFLRSRLLDSEGSPTERLTYDFRSDDYGAEGYKAWLMECWFYHDNSYPGAGDAYPVDVRIQWPTVNTVPQDVDLAIYAFTGGPLDMDPANLLAPDLHAAGELVLNLDNAWGSEYMYKRFWIVASTSSVMLDEPGMAQAALPATTELAGAHPMPFNAATTVNFQLAEPGRVRLAAFNLLGHEVTKLVDGRRPAGRYQVSWNARSLASGVYFLRFDVPGQKVHQVRKVVLQK